MTDQTPKQKLQAAMDELNLTVEATFVPFSQSRNNDEKHPSLNWIVTLKRNGREFLKTDYSAGSAYCPSYNKEPPTGWDRPARFWQSLATAWECENGREVEFVSWGTGGQFRPKPKTSPLMPDADAVVWSLLQDADVLDAGGFEEWASEYGYETDSRKAEAIYRACLEMALKIRAALGQSGLQSLRDAAEDY